MNSTGLLWICIFIEIIILLALLCAPSIGKQVPLNYILLFAFTFAEAYTVSAFTLMFTSQSVLMCAIMTCVIVVALTIYALTTKEDFTLYGGIFWIIGSTLMMLLLLNFFF